MFVIRKTFCSPCILLRFHLSFRVCSSNTHNLLWQSNPITGLDRPWGFQEVEAPRFQDNRHIKVVRLSALRTGRLYPKGNITGTHFCERLSQPQGHSAAGRILSMKNSSDIKPMIFRLVAQCLNQLRYRVSFQPTLVILMIGWPCIIV
jgi:hypothetical protein